MRQIIINAGAVSAAMLTLILAMFAGSGVELRGWVLWYLFALAQIALGGLWARVTR